MARKFRVGDHVSCNSEAGRVSGTVIAVHTADFDYKGHVHHALAQCHHPMHRQSCNTGSPVKVISRAKSRANASNSSSTEIPFALSIDWRYAPVDVPGAHQCFPSLPSALFRSSAGSESVQGLNTGTRALRNSDVSRETTVSPCCCAVAAMIRSG
jgi:hypothetical protein